MKVVTIVGARPQFIKAAAVSRSIGKRNNIEEVIVHTGQHFDANMSEIFFNELSIPVPKYNLDINSCTHGEMTGRMIERIEKVLFDEKPDWVLLYGDTNSTLAGAIAASKLLINIAHVEAGLRSYNFSMPEEQNRILTDRVSNILFCPTSNAIENLKKEGFDSFGNKTLLVGDVMFDAAMFYASKVEATEEKDFLFCTVHRAENTNDIENMKSIVSALNELAKTEKIIFPIHPRTKKKIEEYGIVFNFATVDPMGYLEVIAHLKSAKIVITDSGGMQKEAYFFKKPCVTLREQTEWIELLEVGCNKIVGSNYDQILKEVRSFQSKVCNFETMLYGNGKAADKIVEALLSFKH